jgi:hypothetical protein
VQGEQMPLERGIGEPVETIGRGVLFAMQDGARVVPCTATAGLLKVLLGADPALPVRAYREMREEIEAIASAKYDARALDHDGGITLEFRDARRGP